MQSSDMNIPKQIDYSLIHIYTVYIRKKYIYTVTNIYMHSFYHSIFLILSFR